MVLLKSILTAYNGRTRHEEAQANQLTASIGKLLQSKLEPCFYCLFGSGADGTDGELLRPFRKYGGYLYLYLKSKKKIRLKPLTIKNISSTMYIQSTYNV